ncbi:hypothetical protein SOV_20800 [Sporomusa ovata DSM 2662]|uniref:Uncharacterized protein n=1 Tax=Sporomusa ovata TaxID=2378 RepID=A0A0U1L2T4_9FIRM|nr:hypothetical protein [Sporomusa ovata]EQB25402.1 hypothetical protein SOV_4c00590 [Sporomusa ovata DSM 2662]CQR73966.1 hypothetical protein SpAn4DRAFT_0428 [Sporomusa ovata]
MLYKYEYYDLQPRQLQDQISLTVFYEKVREELGAAFKKAFYQMEEWVIPMVRKMYPTCTNPAG